MLEYNEITPRKSIILDGQPYEVLDAHIFRMQQRKPQNKTKLKNMLTGSVTEITFHQSEKVEEAEIEKKDAKFIYTSRGEWWFSEPNNPSKRFKLSEKMIGDSRKFLKPETIVTTLTFNEEVFGVILPINIELKVTEAPPAVKGDTAKGGLKQVVLETGATISTPLFVNDGDTIRINTQTGEYKERV